MRSVELTSQGKSSITSLFSCCMILWLYIIALYVSTMKSVCSFRIKHRLVSSFHARSMSSIAARPIVYDHLKIEKKWQDYWDENKTFETKRRPGKQKKYVLDMFPYPSGSGLHVGHPEGYTGSDIMARYWRMRDYDVLHPMGWDAFGLPAEQHAINSGTHPRETTIKNIATFKRQLQSLGFSFDWSRELSTTDDSYVKWTQWIFLQMYKTGLAAQSNVSVNWCPALGTVLANEEIINGLSERGQHPVIKQPLRQWVFKISQYAEKLEAGLDKLQWPEGTLVSQRQWIGRSLGASVTFKVENSSQSVLEVYTTRVDTIMGVTYLVLAPDHPQVYDLTTPDQRAAVAAYIEQAAHKSDLERTSIGVNTGKTGVFTGSFAVHPLTGERIPVWLADYVLSSYGTGAVMAVPAHDQRDFDFAQKFNLPLKEVLKPNGASSDTPVELPFDTTEGTLINSGAPFDGMSVAEGISAVIARLAELKAGHAQEVCRLRDWVFSRQRYWGEPIPIYFPVEMQTPDGTGSPIKGDAHRIVYEQPIPVEESELPLKLPEMTDFHPGSNPEGCLARAMEWRYFQKEGKWYARETNTMPQWAGSCWYYLRFTDPHNKEAIFGLEGASWLPVDLYVGGSEHAVLHLLYARFWHKVLFDLGIVNHSEPFTKLVHQGMILGSDGEKMSKSRGNVVNPDDIVQQFGADVLRIYEMFMGPLDQVKPWNTQHVAGSSRFRGKVFSVITESEIADVVPTKEQLKVMHKTLKLVTRDIEAMGFNTVVSHLMIYTNALKEIKGPIPKVMLTNLVLMLSPIAPHLCEECWERLGNTKSLAFEPWPEYDEEYCKADTVYLQVSINGQAIKELAGKEEVVPDQVEADVVKRVLGLGAVKEALTGRTIKKTLFLKNRIVNIITE